MSVSFYTMAIGTGLGTALLKVMLLLITCSTPIDLRMEGHQNARANSTQRSRQPACSKARLTGPGPSCVEDGGGPPWTGRKPSRLALP